MLSAPSGVFTKLVVAGHSDILVSGVGGPRELCVSQTPSFVPDNEAAINSLSRVRELRALLVGFFLATKPSQIRPFSMHVAQGIRPEHFIFFRRQFAHAASTRPERVSLWPGSETK